MTRTSLILPTPLSLAKKLYMDLSSACIGRRLTRIVQSSLWASSACFSILDYVASLTSLLELLVERLFLPLQQLIRVLIPLGLPFALLLLFGLPVLALRPAGALATGRPPPLVVLLVLMMLFLPRTAPTPSRLLISATRPTALLGRG